MNIKHILKIGENAHGYEFKVGLLGDRWIGYADSAFGAFFFPQVSEGAQMGLTDKNEAIKRTLIVALTPEHGYGGVDTYYVDEALRPTPEELAAAEDAVPFEYEGYEDNWDDGG